MQILCKRWRRKRAAFFLQEVSVPPTVKKKAFLLRMRPANFATPFRGESLAAEMTKVAVTTRTTRWKHLVEPAAGSGLTAERHGGDKASGPEGPLAGAAPVALAGSR